MTYTQNNAPFRAIFPKLPPHILLHQLLWSPYKDIERMEEDIFFDYIILNPFCQYMGPIERPLLFKSQSKLSDRTGIFWGQEGSLFFRGIQSTWHGKSHLIFVLHAHPLLAVDPGGFSPAHKIGKVRYLISKKKKDLSTLMKKKQSPKSFNRK